LMTEHERSVNDRDIRAYESMDTKNLYGKLPGFRGHEQAMQDKYIDRMFKKRGGFGEDKDSPDP